MLTDPETWIALATLTALEIVLGIDNIVFIAVLADRVRAEQKHRAYRLGLIGAMFTRVGLLTALSWVMGLTEPLFTLFGREFTGQSLILVGGGLFLIGKSSHEVYVKVEAIEEHGPQGKGKRIPLGLAVLEIMVLDIVFSLDSVITAVGMVNRLPVMIAAIVLAVGIMLLFAERVGDFVNRNPSMKILALSFLLLIGVLLVAEGFGEHVDKGYIYFAMGYAVGVELLNMRFRRKHGLRTAPPPPAGGSAGAGEEAGGGASTGSGG